MHKVLVLGGSGMLGHKLVQLFSDVFETYCTVRSGGSVLSDLNILPAQNIFEHLAAEEFESFETVIRSLRPDVVVNAIGVIKQVAPSNDVERILTINSIFPHRMARLAADVGFRFISVSTDCVFSGKTGNYNESDLADARDLYGLSKYLGEVAGRNCLTLRTSVIGREIGSTHSLIEWFLSQKGSVRGYVNAVFSGFPTVAFGDILIRLIRDFPDLTGLYHVSSEPISKFELLGLVKKRLGLKTEIQKYEEFWIDRSLDSTSFREATGIEPLHWSELVDKMFSDPTPYDEWHRLGEI